MRDCVVELERDEPVWSVQGPCVESKFARLEVFGSSPMKHVTNLNLGYDHTESQWICQSHHLIHTG
jgi:hypothetical protein